MGHLNSFSASEGGNLSKKFPKIQMPGGLPGGGGMFKLRFDWYINLCTMFHSVCCLFHAKSCCLSDSEKSGVFVDYLIAM